MLRLIRPTQKYKKSFLAAFTPDSQYLHYDKKAITADFPQFIRELKCRAHGKYLPPGYMPDMFYWLVEDDQYIGTATLRPRLNAHLRRIGGNIGYMIAPRARRQGYGTQILALALKKANQLGLKKVLITCDETNDPSYKIIIANGGRYKNRVKQGVGLPDKLRFYITL